MFKTIIPFQPFEALWLPLLHFVHVLQFAVLRTGTQWTWERGHPAGIAGEWERVSWCVHQPHCSENCCEFTVPCSIWFMHACTQIQCHDQKWHTSRQSDTKWFVNVTKSVIYWCYRSSQEPWLQAGRALYLWSKGCEFEFRQQQWEKLFLQSSRCVLTLIQCPFHPPCYCSGM